MFIRFCVSFFLLLISTTVVAAEQCSAVFTDGIQNNHNDGFITFNWNARVVNSPDNILDSNNAISDGSGGVSCNTGACSSSGNIALAVNYNDFPNNNNNISVGFLQTQSISPGNYNDINLASIATLNLAPGDYKLSGDLSIGFMSNINIVGSGVVRFFVKKHIDVNSAASINSGGNAVNFLLYAKDDIDVLSSAEITAFVYSEKHVHMNFSAVINGAVSGKDIELTSLAVVNFVATDPDFGDFCGAAPAQPLANYRFDECAYTGVGFEVIDQTGNFSATSHGGVDTFNLGQVERGADLSNEGHHFETSIVLPTDFSVSTWFKKPTSNSDSRYFVLGAMQTGGDLLFIDRNQTWHWGVYNPSTGTARGAFSFNSLDNNWHHMALVYSGGQTQLYIDGVLVDTVNRVPEGTLKFIGTSFDGVNSNNPQGFRAPLDEFIIFDGVLSAAEILNIYTNQNAENNYDGSARAEVLCGLVAHYAMDEATWLGGANLVIDGVSAINGTAFNGANTIGASCRYGQFDGVDDYLQIPHDDALNGSDVLTYVAYIRADSWTGIDQIMAKSVHGGGSGRAQMGIFSENGVFKVRAETVNGRKEINDTLPVPAGDWVHVAAVFSATSLTLYIDGVNVANTTFSATTLVQTTDPLNISKRVGTDVYYFHGLIDDVRVYRSALTQQEVSDLMTSVTPCPLNPIDHFEINHDGNGLTCQPETITIKACADAACSILNQDAIDVQLFINSVPDQVVTVSGGSTNASFVNTNVGTATMSLDQTFECKNGGSTSCDIVFADAGFVLDINGVNDVESCDASKVLLIKAVKLSDNGINCAPAFTGSQPLNFIFNYQNPISGTKVPTLATIDMAAAGVSQNRSITFDGNGEAALAIQYNDAGELNFSVAEVVSSGVSSATLNKEFYPPELIVATALTSTGSGGGVTQAAGVDFPINVIAQSQDGTVTGNYSPQTNATLQLSVQQKEPIANTGVLKVGSVAIAATDLATTTWGTPNQATVNFNGNYSEVGIINLAAQDTNYLGNVINSSSYNTAGRFIPAYFDVNITNNSFEDTCTSGATDFTYIGQPFSYISPPELLITAKNFSGGTTKNYTQPSFLGYQKLTVTDVIRTFPSVDTSQDGSDNATKMAIAVVTTDGSFLTAIDGELKYAFNELDSFTYSKDANSEIGLFTADYDVLINSIQDSDGVNASTSLAAKTPESNTVSPDGVNLRFGRWLLENTFGPETSGLPVPMVLQYWDGSNFLTNSLDHTCTAFNATNLTIDNTNINPGTTSASGSGTFANGATKDVILSAPGTPNQGGVPVIYVIPSMPWLLYDWDWDGVTAKEFNENPNAVATFGLFRGNDRIIYQREVNN